MKRSSILVGLGAAALVAAVVGLRVLWPSRGSIQESVAGKSGGSSPASLDPTRWSRCEEGDFEEGVVGVAGSLEGGGERLRLRAATRGTRDDTVKFLGVRSVRAFHVLPESRFSARLDWNHQSNGSYLSQAVILSPQATSGNPLLGPDWLKVEYIGVPPGENARLLVACRRGGRERFLQTEGWPDTNRKGRKIGLQEIEIIVAEGAAKVLENGIVVFDTKEKVIEFESAHVYLQLSTHSNYPPREVFFDQIHLPAGF